MNEFHTNLDNLQMKVESEQRAVETARAQLPQKGIKGWLNRHGLTATSRQLNKVEADISKVQGLLNKYREIQIEALDLPTIEALNADIENISPQITTLKDLRLTVAKKTRNVFARIGFTRPGKELKEARQELEKAKESLLQSLKDPNQYLHGIVNAKSTKLDDFPTLPTVISAKKALMQDTGEKKLEVALKKIQFADEDISDIYFSHYKNLIGKVDANSPYYFEPQFLAALNNPKFTQFAKQLARDLNVNPEALGESDALWKNFERVIKELNIPGDAAQALVPFLRLLILKMDDSSLLRDSTLEKLEKLVAAAPHDYGKGALQSFAFALEGLKENLRATAKEELQKEKELVLPGQDDASILQSLKALYTANLQLPNRVGYVDEAHRRMFDESPKFQALANEVQALKDDSAETIASKMNDFRNKMLECYGEAFGKREMEVDEFPIMWKLLLIKADDEHLLSEHMVQKLEDAYQLSPGMISPLQGVILTIREEISHISHSNRQ